MLKSVQLKLTKIKYSGDSIGDDIRIEIEILGKFLRVDKRIKAGTTEKIDSEMRKIETDQQQFKTEVTVTVIEKDILFNDVGRAQSTIKIDTSDNKPQKFPFEVQIKETRSIWGKSWGSKTALFEIILEAVVSDAVRYVPDIDGSQGFLIVRIEDSKLVRPVPAFLKLKPERVSNEREYFIILEGPYRGKMASIKLRDNGSSWFISGVNHKPMIRAKYSISQKVFFLKDKKYQATDYPDMPWEKGLYDIEIPDYAHKGGESYMDESKRAMTWFKIGHSGERYLHAGGHSRGCMTIIEVKRWMEIYDSLIKARKGDFMSVGVLEIVD
ncbi:hypothetical protein EPN28_02105 [Patescibacteria group bacterium]|nr:MAG: hypothetical protein EPN28_02105 [Patescibacteria group bacterium]